MEKSTGTPRKIAAHYIHTPQGVLRQGIVCVNREGTITEITTCSNIDSIAGVEHYSGMLVPGFVNAHSHLELSHLHGAISEGGGFAAFAASMGALRNNYTNYERTTAAAFHDARMWADGVSAVADICNGDSTFDIKQSSQINYTNYLELFGLETESANRLASLAQRATTNGLRFTITPHSTYSLNSTPFLESIETSNPALPLSIHFMESQAESELFRCRGELWDWYQSRNFKVDFLGDGSPAERIVNNIAGDRKVMLIHNTYAIKRDIDLLMSHFGENLTWVLCPRSNNYIGRDKPPVELLIESGAKIAIGTDSLASNRSLSIVDELSMFPQIPLTTLLDWATIGGAKALGIDYEYGTIEVGKKSGLVLLTDLDWQAMKLTPTSKSRRIL